MGREPVALATSGATGRAVEAAQVPRGLLVLSGSTAQELASSIWRWASAQVPCSAVRFWMDDERGPHLLVEVGESRHPDDAERARRCLIERTSIRDGQQCCELLLQEGGGDGVLQLDFRSEPPPELIAQLPALGCLLLQRLPAAIELERLHRAVERLAEAEQLQRALYAIADTASASRDMDDVLQRLHQIVGELMYAENFFIALLDRSGTNIRFAYFCDTVDEDPPDPTTGYALEHFRGSLTAHVIMSAEALMGPSESLEARIGGLVHGTGPQSIDWLGVPLNAGGETFGAVVVQSYIESRRYSERDRELLSFVASHIATALLRKRAHDELEERVAERTDELRDANRMLRIEVDERHRGELLQAALFRIAELGSASDSLESFYAAVHRVVGRLLYAENFYIALLSADGSEVEFPYSVDENDLVRPRRKLGRGMTEYVLRTSQPLLADDDVHIRLAESGEVIAHGVAARTWLGVPLICESGTVGVLAVQSYDDIHRYSRRDQELLTFVSYHIANALERKRGAERLRRANAELERRVAERTEALFAANRDLRLQIAERERFERQLQFAASHDALTGLPNRVSFQRRMVDVMRLYRADGDRRFAVLFLDLDRFKVINDSVGHLVGDDLLKEAGNRIAGVVGDSGMVARLGGDEFAILLEPLRADDEAVALADRIIDSLDAPIRVGGKELFTSASIGITVARAHYSNPDELLRDADVALYRAKAKGRRCHEMFDEELRREALHRLEVEGNLRRALVRDEFEPVFQPILCLDGGKVVGYEALLRWRHPQGGLILPGDFLPIAEESGLAEAIDWQVYELVLAQGWALRDTGAYVSINVGARHFRGARFVPDLLRLVERYEFPPTQLCVEVTERTLLEDPAHARELMRQLRASGMRLALDDFGTGYSSLSYLHQFPLDVLKVDRAFVEALGAESGSNAQAVLRAICSLGRSLGLQVVAEGIETRRQLETLRLLGCEHGQGFLFARPQPLEEVLAAAIEGFAPE
jgi:diguanylate cyclase (GGDEF)-like protein